MIYELLNIGSFRTYQKFPNFPSASVSRTASLARSKAAKTASVTRGACLLFFDALSKGVRYSATISKPKAERNNFGKVGETRPPNHKKPVGWLLSWLKVKTWGLIICPR